MMTLTRSVLVSCSCSPGATHLAVDGQTDEHEEEEDGEELRHADWHRDERFRVDDEHQPGT